MDNINIIPAQEIIPAETVEKPALDSVFVSHLRYQDQSEGGGKACTVTCHYLNAESGEKDYDTKAYTLKTSDLDALIMQSSLKSKSNLTARSYASL
jgi:hypothetical protein